MQSPIFEFGKKYEFAINVFQNTIGVSINSIPNYYSVNVEENLLGKVSVRPWRSEIIISSFDVNEI